MKKVKRKEERQVCRRLLLGAADCCQSGCRLSSTTMSLLRISKTEESQVTIIIMCSSYL